MTTQTQSPYQDEISITNCKYDEQSVGRSFKGTKRKLRWEFQVSGKSHSVELYDSKLSGKKKVVANGTIILAPQVIRSLFSFSFYLDTNVVSILQNGNTFECRVNNLSFNHLIELQKNKKIFTKEGTSPISTTAKKSSNPEAPHIQEPSKFDLSEKKENDSNTNNAQFNIIIKERRESSNSGNAEILKEAEKINKQVFSFNFDDITSKKEKHENLLDFHASDGSKPTKLNILDLSLNASSTDNESAKQSPDVNGNINSNPIDSFFSKSEKNLSLESQETKSVPEKSSSDKLNDINDFFETINLLQPKKEMSKIDKLKEMYQSSFVENEASKIDPIYNLFGGPSFSVYNPYQMGRMGVGSPNINNNLSSNLSGIFSSNTNGSNSHPNSEKKKASSDVDETQNNSHSNTGHNYSINLVSNSHSNDHNTNSVTSDQPKNFYPSFGDMPDFFQYNKQKPESDAPKEEKKEVTASKPVNNIFDIFN